MSDWAIFLACFLAIAIGWLLGRFPVARLWQKFKNRGWRKSYMEGIHLLLNEEPDQAIETFIQAWDVNVENFDLHNALANMLRRKGEVDRAIRIHANLLECPKLTKGQVRQATIELAHDYIAAGLLDRAERLLINVVNNSQDFEERALELLQQIYQLEKEWDKAVTVAEQLAPKRQLSFKNRKLSSGHYHVQIAHYYCEMAQQALAEANFVMAEKALEKALQTYPQCARATLLKSELTLEKGNPLFALEILMHLPEQDPHLLVESLPLLERIFAHDDKGLISHLQSLLENYPSVQIEKRVFEVLNAADPFEANEFLTAQVRKRPTLQGLDLLIQQQMDMLQGPARENLQLLHQLVSDVLKNKASYQCKRCGFSGMHMHWLCPQCQSWDTIRRIRGSEGD